MTHCVICTSMIERFSLDLRAISISSKLLYLIWRDNDIGIWPDLHEMHGNRSNVYPIYWNIERIGRI